MKKKSPKELLSSFEIDDTIWFLHEQKTVLAKISRGLLKKANAVEVSALDFAPSGPEREIAWAFSDYVSYIADLKMDLGLALSHAKRLKRALKVKP